MGGVNAVLDLGTGTGCLLLAVLQEFPAAWGLGVDRSHAATALAARNAQSAGLTGRACMLCGDWAAAVAGRFDLILANPPYIESATIVDLMPEVARHEPRAALDGGPDGLAAYRTLLPEFPRLLAPGGVAIIELGAGQDIAVAALARAAGAVSVALRLDYGGIARAAVLRWA
jgi:release factor glutamine methyltransferase